MNRLIIASILMASVLIARADRRDELISEMVRMAAHDPYRAIGGEGFDLSPLFEHLKRIDSWQGRPMREWRLIYGHVQQVLEDGLLVQTERLPHWTFEEKVVFLKNHRALAKAVDGSAVAEFARPIERYQFTSVAGAVRTVEAYDCGSPLPREKVVEINQKKAEIEVEKNRFQLEQAEHARQVRQKALAEKDEAAKRKTVEFQKLQATNGVGYAQFELGIRYLRGDGVDSDIGLAQLWLTRATTNGFSGALTNLSR